MEYAILKTKKIPLDKISIKFHKKAVMGKYDEKIGGKYFHETLKLFEIYLKLFNNKRSAHIFSLKFYPYEYLSPQHYSKYKKDKTTKDIMEKKVNKNIKIKSIMYYKPLTNYFLDCYSIIYKHKLLCTSKKKPMYLEISSYPRYLEAAHYFITRFQKKNINPEYNLICPIKYGAFPRDDFDNLLDNIKNLINNIKINVYRGYINKDFILNNNKKYDIIFSTLSTSLLIGTFYREAANMQIFYYMFIYSLVNLKKNGTLVYNVNNIQLKGTTDIILIANNLFDKVIINKSNVINKMKAGRLTIIFKNFMGINKKTLDKLLMIFDKLYKNDPTGLNFNVKNKLIRDKYNVYKPLNNNLLFKNTKNYKNSGIYIYNSEIINTDNIFPYTEKYPSSFIDYSTSNKIYKFFLNINTNYFLQNIDYLNKMINNFIQYHGKEVPIDIKRENLIKSIMWAKKYDISTIKYENYNFKNKLHTDILIDIYSSFNPTIININSSNQKLKIKIKSEEISFSSLSKILNNITIYTKSRLSDIKKFCKNFKYYNYINIEKYILKYLNENFDTTIHENSKNWGDIYEIMILSNLIDSKKTIRSFHIYDKTGDTINSLNHYITTNSNVNLFIWFAHSENTDISVNEYYKKVNYNLNKIKLYYKNIINFSSNYSGTNLIIANYDYINNSFREYLIELIFILNTLDKGGNVLFKYDINFNNDISQDILYILYKHFDKITFFKPSLSVYDTYYYIVCKSFKKKNKKLLKNLIKFLKNKNNKNRLLSNKYELSFKVQIYNALYKLINIYRNNIDRRVYYSINSSKLPNITKKTYNEIVTSKNKELVKRWDIKKIKDKYLL